MLCIIESVSSNTLAKHTPLRSAVRTGPRGHHRVLVDGHPISSFPGAETCHRSYVASLRSIDKYHHPKCSQDHHTGWAVGEFNYSTTLFQVCSKTIILGRLVGEFAGLPHCAGHIRHRLPPAPYMRVVGTQL